MIVSRNLQERIDWKFLPEFKNILNKNCKKKKKFNKIIKSFLFCLEFVKENSLSALESNEKDQKQ